MTVLAIGDIGVVSGMMHIGDEAMFEAARDELAARAVGIIGVSSAPAESAARYGVPMVARLGFAGLDRSAAEERTRVLVDAAAGRVRLADDDPARGVLAALDEVTGLLNAGGGNLASRWPVHIFERTALAAMARERGLPLVVTGQTFGPDLEDGDDERVASLVRSAALVSVRESISGALVRSWGVPVVEGVDDASFLGWPDGGAAVATGVGAGVDAAVVTGVVARVATGVDAAPVVVSLSGWFAGRPADDVEERIARLLDHAVRTVGPVAFHAHFGPLDPAAEPAGDSALHERVRARMSEPSTVVPTGDSLGAARLARSARLLITSRYHPAVFAAPAGVPVVALAADDYTRIKLTGALAHWGQSSVLDLDDLPSDSIDRARAQREAIASAAADRFTGLRGDAAEWWDAVADALNPAAAGAGSRARRVDVTR
ncbi:polysaccharide pyruvyl transferase family protein [Microbacterium hominis]|uniref:Polysaccharide pyruvyl transferase family protein n=1 Tax=Microbacterium hominis TaxID=162426 RepID=A0A7D4TLU7_9MICO|nr:polysaccharide pyruvyl transferase family protein [Microbacterium hominis]QKJ18562.1 polysaccharide pyruvyl transferase family protein [Microbacterium hominis]